MLLAGYRKTGRRLDELQYPVKKSETYGLHSTSEGLATIKPYILSRIESLLPTSHFEKMNRC